MYKISLQLFPYLLRPNIRTTRLSFSVRLRKRDFFISSIRLKRMPSSNDKYTDPELREEIKEEIKRDDKGGNSGQWSARKAQMMAAEYKKRGGGYTTDKKDESQSHLSQWTEEEWQTREGSADAKQEDGTMKRYLPKKAWEQMTEEGKKETDEKKLAEGEEGRQHVENTDTAKAARQKADDDKDQNKNTGGTSEAADADMEDAQEGGSVKGADEARNLPDGPQPGNDEEHNVEKAESRSPGYSEADMEEAQLGEKRAHGQDDSNNTTKKRKDSTGKGVSMKGTEPPAQQGSKDRMPNGGQTVYWKSPKGYTQGEVVEIVYEEKLVDGKTAKGSRDEPRIVLKSATSGKTAVHKVDAVYFD